MRTFSAPRGRPWCLGRPGWLALLFARVTKLTPRGCSRLTRGRGTTRARHKQTQVWRQIHSPPADASAEKTMAIDYLLLLSYTHPQSHQRPRSPRPPQILFLLATGCHFSRRRSSLLRRRFTVSDFTTIFISQDICEREENRGKSLRNFCDLKSPFRVFPLLLDAGH